MFMWWSIPKHFLMRQSVSYEKPNWWYSRLLVLQNSYLCNSMVMSMNINCIIPSSCGRSRRTSCEVLHVNSYSEEARRTGGKQWWYSLWSRRWMSFDFRVWKLSFLKGKSAHEWMHWARVNPFLSSSSSSCCCCSVVAASSLQNPHRQDGSPMERLLQGSFSFA
jgi:hypothetical protein